MNTTDLNSMARTAKWPATRAAICAIARAPAKLPPTRPEPAVTSPDVTELQVEIEVRTQTECNTSETHWAKAKRAKWQRGRVQDALGKRVLPALPVTVAMTRIAPGTLDAHDNLASAFKHITDHIADLYGVQDNDPRIEWQRPTQEKAKRYAVRVAVRSVAEGGAA